jgi:hypothetical protein
MERLEHLGVPAGNGGIAIPDGVKEQSNHHRAYAGHIAGCNKGMLTVHRKRPRMQPADRSKSSPDIRYTPDITEVAEPFTLFGIPGDQHDLIHHLPQGIDETVDEGLALDHKEVLLPPTGTLRLSPNKYDR